MNSALHKGWMSWAETVARLAKEEIDEDWGVDMEEEIFECPYCQEPIYADDYPEIPVEIDPDTWVAHPYCPICGSFYEN